jgi:Fe-S oxidoreductase
MKQHAMDVAKHCYTFDAFVHKHMTEGNRQQPFYSPGIEVKVHGHCHQKALVGMHPTLALLKAIPLLKVSEIASGCCGMAGSFGYESEHHDLSLKISSLRLVPEIEQTPAKAYLIANGFSCRNQIEYTTTRKAIHMAEFLAYLLENKPP